MLNKVESRAKIIDHFHKNVLGRVPDKTEFVSLMQKTMKKSSEVFIRR